MKLQLAPLPCRHNDTSHCAAFSVNSIIDVKYIVNRLKPSAPSGYQM